MKHIKFLCVHLYHYLTSQINFQVFVYPYLFQMSATISELDSLIAHFT